MKASTLSIIVTDVCICLSVAGLYAAAVYKTTGDATLAGLVWGAGTLIMFAFLLFLQGAHTGRPRDD